MKQQVFKGEITAFLSLIFVLLLSLVGTMIQSASIHINKSMKRADTELAMESVFAEYNTKMLEEYDIFVRVGRDEKEISRRLWFYGAKNMEHNIQKIWLLTDNHGQSFYQQAVRSMGGEVEEIQTSPERSYEKEEQKVVGALEEILVEEGQSLPWENNPIELVKQLKQQSLLGLVLPHPEKLSNRYVKLEELPSHRSLHQGTENLGNSVNGNGAEKLLFTAYLTEHFPDYTKGSTVHSLFYEAEYLLCGCSSDEENLEAVAKKLLTVRTTANYTYLLTDQVRQAEAETMALGLCSLLTAPVATTLVKQAILFAWAYGESILDLRVLFRGERIPLVKTNENWQLQLTSLFQLGTLEEIGEEGGAAEGLSYGDYIHIFLFAEDKEALCMRALDLLELNLGIRVDGCVTALEIKSTYKMQRGIIDTFLTDYQYE